MEACVIASCKNIFNNIAADVEKKYLLKDEQYFQGELYLDMQPRILDVNDEWTVKMGYNHPHLTTGKVDLAVVDQRRRSLLLTEVVRQTEHTEPKSFIRRLIRLATLVAWNQNVDATGMIIWVGDSRAMAEISIPNDTTLYKKRTLLPLDKLDVMKQSTDNFEKYLNNLSNELCLKPPKNETIPENFTVEFLRQFSTTKAVRDEQKFAMTIWRVRANTTKAFLTEVEKGEADNSIAVTRQKYKIYNRKWQSKPFRLSNKDRVYLYDEICLGKDEEE